MTNRLSAISNSGQGVLENILWGNPAAYTAGAIPWMEAT